MRMSDLAPLRTFLPDCITSGEYQIVQHNSHGTDLLPGEFPLRRTFAAAVLFLDISGFTKLSEAVAKNGPVAGCQRLADHLNSYFSMVARVVASHGGDLIKFAGDAAIIVWPVVDCAFDAVRSAGQAGLELQVCLHRAQLAAGVVLSAKIGISVGQVAMCCVGGHNDRWEAFVTGPAVAESFHAQQCASEGGESWMTRLAWQTLHSGGQSKGASTARQLTQTAAAGGKGHGLRGLSLPKRSARVLSHAVESPMEPPPSGKGAWAGSIGPSALQGERNHAGGGGARATVTSNIVHQDSGMGSVCAPIFRVYALCDRDGKRLPLPMGAAHGTQPGRPQPGTGLWSPRGSALAAASTTAVSTASLPWLPPTASFVQITADGVGFCTRPATKVNKQPGLAQAVPTPDIDRAAGARPTPRPLSMGLGSRSGVVMQVLAARGSALSNALKDRFDTKSKQNELLNSLQAAVAKRQERLGGPSTPDLPLGSVPPALGLSGPANATAHATLKGKDSGSGLFARTQSNLGMLLARMQHLGHGSSAPVPASAVCGPSFSTAVRSIRPLAPPSLFITDEPSPPIQQRRSSATFEAILDCVPEVIDDDEDGTDDGLLSEKKEAAPVQLQHVQTKRPGVARVGFDPSPLSSPAQQSTVPALTEVKPPAPQVENIASMVKKRGSAWTEETVTYGGVAGPVPATSMPLDGILHQLVPGALVQWVRAGQQGGWHRMEQLSSHVRSAVIMFACLGIPSDVMISSTTDSRSLYAVHHVLRAAQCAITEYGGVLNKFLWDDKGATLLAIFGAPTDDPAAEPDDDESDSSAVLGLDIRPVPLPSSHARKRLHPAAAAVLSGQTLLAALSPWTDACTGEGLLHARAQPAAGRVSLHGCSVGITHGAVYCGIVGAANRREYGILGDAANTAARLMVKAVTAAGPVPLLVDEATACFARSSGLPMLALPALTLKGKAQPVPVYTPSLGMSQAQADANLPACSNTPSSPVSEARSARVKSLLLCPSPVPGTLSLPLDNDSSSARFHASRSRTLEWHVDCLQRYRSTSTVPRESHSTDVKCDGHDLDALSVVWSAYLRQSQTQGQERRAVASPSPASAAANSYWTLTSPSSSGAGRLESSTPRAPPVYPDPAQRSAAGFALMAMEALPSPAARRASPPAAQSNADGPGVSMWLSEAGDSAHIGSMSAGAMKGSGSGGGQAGSRRYNTWRRQLLCSPWQTQAASILPSSQARTAARWATSRRTSSHQAGGGARSFLHTNGDGAFPTQNQSAGVKLARSLRKAVGLEARRLHPTKGGGTLSFLTSLLPTALHLQGTGTGQAAWSHTIRTRHMHAKERAQTRAQLLLEIQQVRGLKKATELGEPVAPPQPESVPRLQRAAYSSRVLGVGAATTSVSRRLPQRMSAPLVPLEEMPLLSPAAVEHVMPDVKQQPPATPTPTAGGKSTSRWGTSASVSEAAANAQECEHGGVTARAPVVTYRAATVETFLAAISHASAERGDREARSSMTLQFHLQNIAAKAYFGNGMAEMPHSMSIQPRLLYLLSSLVTCELQEPTAERESATVAHSTQGFTSIAIVTEALLSMARARLLCWKITASADSNAPFLPAVGGNGSQASAAGQGQLLQGQWKGQTTGEQQAEPFVGIDITREDGASVSVQLCLADGVTDKRPWPTGKLDSSVGAARAIPLGMLARSAMGMNLPYTVDVACAARMDSLHPLTQVVVRVVACMTCSTLQLAVEEEELLPPGPQTGRAQSHSNSSLLLPALSIDAVVALVPLFGLHVSPADLARPGVPDGACGLVLAALVEAEQNGFLLCGHGNGGQAEGSLRAAPTALPGGGMSDGRVVAMAGWAQVKAGVARSGMEQRLLVHRKLQSMRNAHSIGTSALGHVARELVLASKQALSHSVPFHASTLHLHEPGVLLSLSGQAGPSSSTPAHAGWILVRCSVRSPRLPAWLVSAHRSKGSLRSGIHVGGVAGTAADGGPAWKRRYAILVHDASLVAGHAPVSALLLFTDECDACEASSGMPREVLFLTPLTASSSASCTTPTREAAGNACTVLQGPRSSSLHLRVCASFKRGRMHVKVRDVRVKATAAGMGHAHANALTRVWTTKLSEAIDKSALTRAAAGARTASVMVRSKPNSTGSGTDAPWAWHNAHHTNAQLYPWPSPLIARGLLWRHSIVGSSVPVQQPGSAMLASPTSSRLSGMFGSLFRVSRGKQQHAVPPSHTARTSLNTLSVGSPTQSRASMVEGTEDCARQCVPYSVVEVTRLVVFCTSKAAGIACTSSDRQQEVLEAATGLSTGEADSAIRSTLSTPSSSFDWVTPSPECATPWDREELHVTLIPHPSAMTTAVPAECIAQNMICAGITVACRTGPRAVLEAPVVGCMLSPPHHDREDGAHAQSAYQVVILVRRASHASLSTGMLPLVRTRLALRSKPIPAAVLHSLRPLGSYGTTYPSAASSFQVSIGLQDGGDKSIASLCRQLHGWVPTHSRLRSFLPPATILGAPAPACVPYWTGAVVVTVSLRAAQD